MGRLVHLVFACSLARGSSKAVNDWELENLFRYREGQLNVAELGLANLKMGMRNPSYMSEVAQWLRHPDGQAHYIKMMANPSFKGEAQNAAELLKKDGILPNFL